MLKNLIERISILIVILLSTTLYVNANVYTSNENDGSKKINLTYNSVNGDLSATYNLIPGQTHDSWWMVITDGPHPAYNNNVQLIGDLETNTITAYSYVPHTGQTNYQQGTYLGTFNNALTTDGTNFGFNINVSDINQKSADLGGTPFEIGEQAGVWFKRGVDSTIDYNADGSITTFTAHEFDNIIDYSSATTTVTPYTPPNPGNPVSEPTGLLVTLSALGLFFGIRKKS